ncbi:iron complex transport system substrate-binding protein [Paenibacillus sp. UNCCL117]|uniref:ABC transporter substrate-binding protein n=1 Tax=unclassified Paenibacillus TaxID=185978 RepID=UPI0008800CB4|nr:MULTISPECIES: iron-siderophore ABC transporter substrate-binding protein [unclassified Paenibacillus]SDE08455.1 iron complex transport system substrate-binding protein [Paenibacillus sp. cl123]SFW58951.1 iron complex transport system substrate-binding protein [Paenibacillus sp. UNCCL117]
MLFIRHVKQTAVISIILIFALVISACGTKDSGSSGAAGAAGGKPESPAAAGKPYKVTHAMGETEIPAVPKRVVILTNEGTEALLALGVKPVGAVKSFTGNPWYEHIQADMEGVTVLGEESQPNLELIASLQPDLIIGNKMRQEKVYEQLKAIAPTVFSETLRGEWKNNFRLYAEALGKKEEGDKVIAAFDNRIEDFKSKAGDKLQQKVSVVRFMAGKTRIYLADTFTGIIFKQIGIARPVVKSKDNFAEEIPKERLPEADGDMIFYFTYETGDGKGSKQEQEWLQDPLWKNLNAVKNNKVYRVNDAIWNTAGGVKAANLMLDELYKIYGIQA